MNRRNEARAWRCLGRALLATAVIATLGLAAESIAELEPAKNAPPVEKQAAIEPLYVRPLMPVESGRNDSNPVWSPSGALIAFERSRGEKKEIVIARPDGVVVQIIYHHFPRTARSRSSSSAGWSRTSATTPGSPGHPPATAWSS